jgi:hypothetical protein
VVGTRRIVVTMLVLMAIVLPTARYASASAFDGHHVTVRHAPRTPSGSARTAAVSAVSARPLLGLMPVAAVWSAVAVVVVAPPLSAPFVPPRG